MLDSIRAFVAQKIAKPAATPGPAPANGAQLAACALLLELAHADGEFTVQERLHIEGALGRHFGLDQATIQELIGLAETARAQAIDQFQFTRQISASYDLGQKMVLAEVMWGVILSDGKIAEHEAYLVRKLANLLELEPGYLAQARRAASAPP
jgi:uncharacterized tellurite resistance protein B-like protein